MASSYLLLSPNNRLHGDRFSAALRLQAGT